MKLILGSASEGRRHVLSQMFGDFEVVSAGIDEKAIRSDDPVKLTLMLAHAKADALLPRIHEDAVLITSDQVVYFEGNILEKVNDLDEARARIRSYSGKSIRVVDGIVVTRTSGNRRLEASDESKIFFSEIPKEGVEQIVSNPQIFNWAGGFGVEHEIGRYITGVNGEHESIVGLPRKKTEELLQRIGYYGKN